MVTAAAAEDRRLITVETVRALTGLSESDVADETLELLIDAALAQCATFCKLARDGAKPLTLAQEEVRATWPESLHYVRWPREWYLDDGRTQLILPWRAPITDITITEAGVELEENVDFQLLGAGLVERLGAGLPCCWGSGIVAEYTAGWAADPEDGEVMPADLVAEIVAQIKYGNELRGREIGLRSEDVPGVWSGSYNVAGGDSISSSGLLRSLEMALTPYRAPPTIA